MSICNQEQEKEAYIVNQEALNELRKLKNQEQTVYETMQNLGSLDLSFVEWQFLNEEAFRILDKKYFKLFKGIAVGKILDLAKSYLECLAVYNLVEKDSGKVAKVLEKMKKMTKSEREKQEMEYLIEKNA